MKTTFIFTRKILCVILSFTLLTLALVACANPTDGTEETTTAETIYVPESGEPTEELLERIKKDYYQSFYGTLDGYDSEKSICISKCYGIYNECVVLIISPTDVTFPGICVDEEIAGVEFHYGNPNTIEVWCNHKFYSLQSAYQESFLTKEDLQAIADLHNKWNSTSSSGQPPYYRSYSFSSYFDLQSTVESFSNELAESILAEKNERGEQHAAFVEHLIAQKRVHIPTIDGNRIPLYDNENGSIYMSDHQLWNGTWISYYCVYNGRRIEIEISYLDSFGENLQDKDAHEIECTLYPDRSVPTEYKEPTASYQGEYLWEAALRDKTVCTTVLEFENSNNRRVLFTYDSMIVSVYGDKDVINPAFFKNFSLENKSAQNVTDTFLRSQGFETEAAYRNAMVDKRPPRATIGYEEIAIGMSRAEVDTIIPHVIRLYDEDLILDGVPIYEFWLDKNGIGVIVRYDESRCIDHIAVYANLPQEASAENLYSVVPGMSIYEVVDLLGFPCYCSVDFEGISFSFVSGIIGQEQVIQFEAGSMNVVRNYMNE